MKTHLQRLTAVLFVVGSTCFLVGPFPGFVDVVGARADAALFLVGSLFFTAAATLQLLGTRGTETSAAARWSSVVQLFGTLFFNLSTYRALSSTWESGDYDQVVWRPDLFGSICFLVSGFLAYADVFGGLLAAPRRTPGAAMTAVNLFGSFAFGVSALAAYVVPGTSTAVNAAVSNAGTAIGALAFLVGAVLLLRGSDDGAEALARSST